MVFDQALQSQQLVLHSLHPEQLLVLALDSAGERLDLVPPLCALGSQLTGLRVLLVDALLQGAYVCLRLRQTLRKEDDVFFKQD